MKYYKCMDFRFNFYLRMLYVVILIYLAFSANQLAYGFSLIRKPSSVLQKYDPNWKILADVYMFLPFVVEMKCCLDFAFSHTSLDIW
jgi:hypothetical protein